MAEPDHIPRDRLGREVTCRMDVAIIGDEAGEQQQCAPGEIACRCSGAGPVCAEGLGKERSEVCRYMQFSDVEALLHLPPSIMESNRADVRARSSGGCNIGIVGMSRR